MEPPYRNWGFLQDFDFAHAEWSVEIVAGASLPLVAPLGTSFPYLL